MKDQLSPQTIYEMVAEVGFRRHFHLGGMEATKELVELCYLQREHHVLDVGCASGKTACYIAAQYGCRVVGIDILEGMVDRAMERADREGLADKVSFQTADAQDLPFDDGQFDVVIGEFITGLLEDKRRAVTGYMRVTKPGGRIGLNEATWVKTPAPAELVEYLSGVFGVQGEILDSGDWRELLTGAGLRDLELRIQEVDSLSSPQEALRDLLRVWPKVVWILIRNSSFRSFLGETLSIPKDLLEYFGYGIYVGDK